MRTESIGSFLITEKKGTVYINSSVVELEFTQAIHLVYCIYQEGYKAGYEIAKMTEQKKT